ncbi:hypothetical protein Goshw_004035, partial [Gossypium schwendimanii]|nr:hypothetical protein [Gossypium aridum]MBA0862074.1 hypothetical protein [Gossypium schwendimanii]
MSCFRIVSRMTEGNVVESRTIINRHIESAFAAE